jgi:hypothetical protein
MAKGCRRTCLDPAAARGQFLPILVCVSSISAFGKRLSQTIREAIDAWSMSCRTRPLVKKRRIFLASTDLWEEFFMAVFDDTANPEVLLGGIEDDIISGFAVNDTLKGAAGKDSLSGDASDDFLTQAWADRAAAHAWAFDNDGSKIGGARPVEV